MEAIVLCGLNASVALGMVVRSGRTGPLAHFRTGFPGCGDGPVIGVAVGIECFLKVNFGVGQGT